jgi:hypothetical protein
MVENHSRGHVAPVLQTCMALLHVGIQIDSSIVTDVLDNCSDIKIKIDTANLLKPPRELRLW